MKQITVTPPSARPHRFTVRNGKLCSQYFANTWVDNQLNFDGMLAAANSITYPVFPTVEELIRISRESANDTDDLYAVINKLYGTLTARNIELPCTDDLVLLASKHLHGSHLKGMFLSIHPFLLAHHTANYAGITFPYAGSNYRVRESGLQYHSLGGWFSAAWSFERLEAFLTSAIEPTALPTGAEIQQKYLNLLYDSVSAMEATTKLCFWLRDSGFTKVPRPSDLIYHIALEPKAGDWSVLRSILS